VNNLTKGDPVITKPTDRKTWFIKELGAIVDALATIVYQ
jgi:hypothetical protein